MTSEKKKSLGVSLLPLLIFIISVMLVTKYMEGLMEFLLAVTKVIILPCIMVTQICRIVIQTIKEPAVAENPEDEIFVLQEGTNQLVRKSKKS